MIESLFLRNPWFRAIIPIFLMGVAGVTASSLVAEIAEGNVIHWSLIPEKVSFYVILISISLSAYYQIKLSRHDAEIGKGFTAKQYEAAIRNKVAEEVARRSKKLIRDGHIEQLEKETGTFKRIYGEGVE